MGFIEELSLEELASAPFYSLIWDYQLKQKLNELKAQYQLSIPLYGIT